MFTQLHCVYQELQMASYNKVKAILFLLNTLHENFQKINDANAFWQGDQTLEYLNLSFALWGMWEGSATLFKRWQNSVEYTKGIEQGVREPEF